jgi:anti-anti-sigma factor
MDPSLRTFTIYRRAPGRYTLCGQLDIATAPQLDELDDVHGPLLLNLRGVSVIDASGVSGLVRLYERCPHPTCMFLIEECSPQAARVLRIAGLYELHRRRPPPERGRRPSRNRPPAARSQGEGGRGNELKSRDRSVRAATGTFRPHTLLPAPPTTGDRLRQLAVAGVCRTRQPPSLRSLNARTKYPSGCFCVTPGQRRARYSGPQRRPQAAQPHEPECHDLEVAVGRFSCN